MLKKKVLFSATHPPIVTTHPKVLCDGADLVKVVCAREGGQPVWVESSAARVQLGAVVLSQLRAERVDRNDERAAICLKLGGEEGKTSDVERLV